MQRLISLVLLTAIAAAGVVLCSPLQARPVPLVSYQGLFNAADLVVIATPINRTADTSERTVFHDISRSEDGRAVPIEAIGVETRFRVSLVFNGDTKLKTFVLHHYRERARPAIEANGPGLVFFDPADVGQRHSWLLFLVRESDGRYAPAGRQTDPAYQAFHALPHRE
jgi:hypothetical protein